MLDAVYVDTIYEKSIVAITPKPAFAPLFEVAMTRPDSGVVLLGEKELPPVDDGREAATSPCLWWRRGRVELYLKHGLIVLLAGNWAGTRANVPVPI